MLEVGTDRIRATRARRPGQGLGLRDAGYYALDALRIEQGRRAWGAELGPDETPWQAGLAFSLLRRLRQVVWIGLGVLVLLLAHARMRLAPESPA